MFQRILVPLDGSERAERALPVAARLARTSSGSIVLLQVVTAPIEFAWQEMESPGQTQVAFEDDRAKIANYLGRMATLPALAGIDITTAAPIGTAAQNILAVARAEHVDLIVMGSHGYTGFKRWFFGSVAQEIEQHSSIPVLVLNETGGPFPEVDAAHPVRLLVPLDGSPLAETALEPAIQLAVALAAPAQPVIDLLRIVDLPLDGYVQIPNNTSQQEASQEAKMYLQALVQRLQQGAGAADTFTINSLVAVNMDVAGTILKLAEHLERTDGMGGYHLIAMATHGRRGLRRVVMGSVTEHVLQATRLPLLIVPPH